MTGLSRRALAPVDSATLAISECDTPGLTSPPTGDAIEVKVNRIGLDQRKRLQNN